MAGQMTAEGDETNELLEEALSNASDPEVRYHIREAMQLYSEKKRQ